MNIKDYLKDRTLFLMINFILFTIIWSIMVLVNLSANIIILIFSIWFLPVFSFIIVEYMKLKKFYSKVISIMDELDKKYLLAEIMKEPEFIEGKLTYDLLKQAYKDMHEHVKKYKDMENEYREYIETWVHEIKTPIASARLIIENNQNEVTRNINYEIKKLKNT